MEFIGGLMGVRQDPQMLTLRPEIGWAVWEAGAVQRRIKADAEAAAKIREVLSVDLQQVVVEAPGVVAKNLQKVLS